MVVTNFTIVIQCFLFSKGNKHDACGHTFFKLINITTSKEYEYN